MQILNQIMIIDKAAINSAIPVRMMMEFYNSLEWTVETKCDVVLYKAQFKFVFPYYLCNNIIIHLHSCVLRGTD